MGSNIDTANNLLKQAEAAVSRRDFELARGYTDMAAVVAQAHLADKIARVAEKIDRLASVVNNGRSWK